MFYGEKRPSLRSRLMSAALKKETYTHMMTKPIDIKWVREYMLTQAEKSKPPKNVTVEHVSTGGIKGEWLTPDTVKRDGCLLYLHGGGYCFGAPITHRLMVAGIARAAKIRVFSLDYRLAPENPFPSGLDDALAAYDWLVAQGVKEESIVVAGDSAGGGLALSLLLKLKSMNKTLPKKSVLISPWTDLALTGKSIQANKKSCVMMTEAVLETCSEAYLSDADANDPFASPLYGDLEGLPPMLVYVSTTESIHDDATRLAEKAGKNGVDVSLRIWAKQPHAWPIFYPIIPESKVCVNEMGKFISS